MNYIACVARLIACGVLNIGLASAAAAADPPRPQSEPTIHVETIRTDQAASPVQCDPLPPLNMG